MNALLPACACALLLVLSSPYVADIVALLQRTAGPYYGITLASILAVAASALLLWTMVRIRERRGSRYLVLGVSVLLAAFYVGAFRTGNTEIDLVEAFHFLEYGVLAALFHRAWRFYQDGRRVAFPLLAGFIVGVADEWVQWFVPGRVGELHDVLLNLAAVAIGLLVALTLDPPSGAAFTVHGRAARHITAFAASTLVLLAGFVYAAHVGYEIRDEAGTFRSRFDRVTLQVTAIDRARAWAGHPPAYRSRFSREDHYFAEALWHVRERNDALSAGDQFTAWREQLILERFFTPALAIAEYNWPAEQRAAIAEQTRGSETTPYVSAAEALPIYVLR